MLNVSRGVRGKGKCRMSYDRGKPRRKACMNVERDFEPDVERAVAGCEAEGGRRWLSWMTLHTQI